MTTDAIAERVRAVRAAVDDAARAAGRDPHSVHVVAASKYADADAIRAAADAGQRDFGENYLQRAVEKMRALGRADVRWHFIGALQSNKAALAARTFHLIHTLSSESALRAIARAVAPGAHCRVLVQVHLGGSGERAGLDPGAVPAFVRAAASTAGIVVDGLMGIAPVDEPARPHFARLRALLEELRALDLPHAPLREMSAGMSDDYADAIHEGATLVRIGRAFFGR
jgi:pyridoxal phosphate enzyme (YggS family)